MPDETPTAAALEIYAELFTLLAWLGVGAGAAFLLLAPALRRRMHGVH